MRQVSKRSFHNYNLTPASATSLPSPIGDEFDLLIGVTAIENKLTLITDNAKDFARLDGIKIENWFERK